MLTVTFKLDCKLHVISCLASSFVHKKSEMGSDRNVHQSIPEWQTVSSFIEQPNPGLAISQVVRATRSYAEQLSGHQSLIVPALSETYLAHQHLLNIVHFKA